MLTTLSELVPTPPTGSHMTTAASETKDLAFKYLVCVTSYRSEPTGVQIDVAYHQ